MTPTIQNCSLPDAALLRRYADQARPEHAGAYTDCFTTPISGQPDFDAYVFAFYTTWLFRLERTILATFVGRPSSDDEARALADGSGDAFAAWTVEARAPDQLLLCDFAGRTRSWLMREPGDDLRSVNLYFGSAVMPSRRARDRSGTGMRLVLPAHRLYSRLLLGAARTRLANTR